MTPPPPLSGIVDTGTLFDHFLDLLKKIPIDLGQGHQRYTTKGKVIALSLVPPGNGKKALDVGCEEGVQSRWLQSKGYAVTSIDHIPRFPEAKKVDANDPLPFPDQSFDLLWCSEVIEHLNNPPAFAKELRRVLKDGGTMILTTPNSFFWFYHIAALFGLTPAKLQNRDHKHFFSERDIRTLFPSADLYGYFPYTFLKCTIRRCLSLLTPTFVIRETKTHASP